MSLFQIHFITFHFWVLSILYFSIKKHCGVSQNPSIFLYLSLTSFTFSIVENQPMHFNSHNPFTTFLLWYKKYTYCIITVILPFPLLKRVLNFFHDTAYPFQVHAFFPVVLIFHIYFLERIILCIPGNAKGNDRIIPEKLFHR